MGKRYFAGWAMLCAMVLALTLQAGAAPADAATRTPAVPSGVTLVETKYESFTFKWSPARYATSYTVKIATNSSFTKGVQTFGTTKTQRKPINLKNCTTYYYKVRANNGSKASSKYSAAKKVTLKCFWPGKFTTITAKPKGGTGIVLEWKRPENATRFVVWRSTKSDFSSGVVKFPATTGTTLTDTTLKASKPGISHYYRIYAYNKANTTNVRQAPRIEANLRPPVPQGLTLAARSARGVTLKWAASANARQYQVRVATDAAFTKNAETFTTVDAGTRLTLNSLAPGTTYYVKVRARNGKENVVTSPYTAALSATTRAEGAKITAMSFNVLSATLHEERPWSKRLPAVVDDVVSNGVDVLGAQEAFASYDWAGNTYDVPQWESLRRALAKEGYQRAKTGTDGKFNGACVAGSGCDKDEYGLYGNHIYYNTATVEPVGNGGRFNLANGSCSKSDRAAGWQVFQTVGSNQKFIAVNTHLFSDGITKRGAYETCRVEQAKVILAKLATINTGKLPVVLLGDLNSHEDHKPMAVLANGGLNDTAGLDVPRTKANYNSSHGFTNPPPNTYGTQIDYVLASGTIGVDRWKLIADIDPDTGRFSSPIPSDHHAILADLVLPKP